jgi:formate/nitrite transporter FocA (FNT family)
MHRHGTDGPDGDDGAEGSEGAHAADGAHTAASWAMASRATLHCLTGCAFGEVLGLVIGTAFAWHDVPTMVTAIALAFVFGYSLTMYAVLRAGLGTKAAVKVALAADTVSIVVMEAVDNSVVVLVPGALDAHLADLLFWGSLALSFAVAFVVTTPVNRWMIGRGKGHAVLHDYH